MSKNNKLVRKCNKSTNSIYKKSWIEINDDSRGNVLH